MQVQEFMLPPVECPSRFIAVMGRAASGVSVVTTDGIAGRFGVTVSAISSVSAEPPLILACVNRKSPIVTAIDANGVFCVNLLAVRQQPIADTFAGRPRSGRPYDFGCADWLVGETGAPVLPEAAASFECSLEAAHDAGTHRIFIGRVLKALGGEAEPLVYSARAYRRIVEL
ncbi:MAG: flavin reductase family protein [Parvibaculaceae bacterium]